jgi:adenylosuccinate lyase
MIPRYSRAQMTAIWTDQNRYQCWLDVELAALEAMVAHGLAPEEAFNEVKAKAAFEPERVEEIENVTRHDVIAFLTNVAEHVGPASRYVHLGMTSSDVLDTAYNMQLVQAADILLADLDELLAVLKRRAHEHKDTVQIGRSHGIHAEPITFGLKLAIWYDETRRNRARLVAAREDVRVGKISGAVGTFAHLPPTVEEQALAKLGLQFAPASSQIVQRDRHAAFFTALAILGGSMEKMAVEIRHLQRTEVYEAEEFFHKGQKGSSAMPHKRNPVLTENVSGLCRLLRGYAMTALENQPLWHERDISHSSVERIIGPDATTIADFALARLTGVLDKLLVYPDRMQKNLEITGGLYASQTLLLDLVRAGLTREDAYKIVQRNAMPVWEQGADFLETLLADEELMSHVDEKTIRDALDIKHQLRHVDDIFRRVFSEA